MNLPEKLREKLRALPNKPGCYLMRDRNGTIIYVGKAVSLRKRVQSYFRDATFRKAPPKLRGLIRSVRDLDIVVVRTEAEAILTEGKLIKDYKPRYNVLFRDDKRFLLLRTQPSDPFPRFTLCRIQRPDGAVYFGPYASSRAARATLDFIEKRFGLRKCTPRLPDQDTYKHCLNDIIRFCTAPCVGSITPEAYRERVEEAIAFLRGERPALLEEVKRDMEKAAETLDYERAAALRDTLLHLRATIRERGRVSSPPGLLREQARRGILELRDALELDRPPRVIETFDISHISGTYAVAGMVVAVDGLPRRNRYRRFRIRNLTQNDDPASMAEVIRRRYSRLLEEGGERPDLVLVDGGMTQLRAARAELRKLGLESLACAGLAKRQEELYRHEDKPPLRLPLDSAAMAVLRRIRDEAHRFAITYHRTLRNRRIRESLLDDIEGIGEKRKRLLLEHFGSVSRLANADVEAIAAVPGIGPKIAEDVYRSLHGAS